MAKRLLKWSFIAVVLLAAHGYTLWWSARRFAWDGVQTPSGPLKLEMSFDEWTSHDPGADPTVYLNVARNLAAGRGLVERLSDSERPRYVQFNHWGPGTPTVLGIWLWLTGGRTMWTFFWLTAASQLLFGVLAVATAALWTRNTLALALVAFCTGYCPPLRDLFCGTELTSAEIIALPITAAAIFALAKAFQSYHAARTLDCSSEERRGAGAPSRLLTLFDVKRLAVGASPNSWRRIAVWFFVAGALIGLASLCRDCLRVFATFTAMFLVARAVLADRRRLALACGAAVALTVGVHVVRYPVQLWNKQRTGRSVICQSSEGCIFRYGLWFRHDDLPWYDAAGIGFGEYLDPAAATRVADYYRAGKPLPDLYSLAQLLRAIVQRPRDALAFKVARLPVLWLAADQWPDVRWGRTQLWCLGMYGLLAIYCGLQYRRRRPIPEVLYLYLLLVACALPLIHFEFRYTVPVWNTLVLAPGLLLAALAPSERSCAGDASKRACEADSLTADNRKLATAA